MNVTSYSSITGKNAKTVDQLIESAITSLKTMRAKVQVASVAILMHAEKTGDYRKANVLLEGLGNGINRASLQKYFVDFGGLVLDEDSKSFVGWSGDEYIKSHFEAAKSTEWWSLKEAPAYKGFDLNNEISKLIKRAVAESKKADSLSEEDRAKLSVPDDKLKRLRLIVGNVAEQEVEQEITVDELLAKAS